MSAENQNTPTDPKFSRGLIQRRFMRSMSVGKKLWINTAILAIPLVGLGIFYVETLSSTYFFTTLEQKGLELYHPSTDLSRVIGRHAELEVMTLGRRGVAHRRVAEDDQRR